MKEKLTIYNVPKDLLAEFMDKVKRPNCHEEIVQAIINLMEKLVVEKKHEVKVVYSGTKSRRKTFEEQTPMYLDDGDF